MNWHSESFGSWKARVTTWHYWFAWHPVYSAESDQGFWLEHVKRRLVHYSRDSGYCYWEYKAAVESV